MTPNFPHSQGDMSGVIKDTGLFITHTYINLIYLFSLLEVTQLLSTVTQDLTSTCCSTLVILFLITALPC